MSHAMPIKLSGELVEEARTSAKLFHRSLTGQIEHWATLGRVLEAQLPGDSIAELLTRMGGSLKISRTLEQEQRQQVAGALADFLSQSPVAKDHSWLNELSERGIPLYGTTSTSAGKIVRRDPAEVKSQATS